MDRFVIRKRATEDVRNIVKNIKIKNKFIHYNYYLLLNIHIFSYGIGIINTEN